MTIERPRESPLLTIAGGMPGEGLAYLATPYTDYEAGREFAFREACRLAGILIRAGISIYSPIAHLHPIADAAEIENNAPELWDHNLRMLQLCSVLIRAEMPGWQKSDGMARELGAFIKAGKSKIYQLDPVTMTMRRLVQPASQL